MIDYNEHNADSIWSDYEWNRGISPGVYPVQTRTRAASVYTISDQTMEGYAI